MGSGSDSGSLTEGAEPGPAPERETVPTAARAFGARLARGAPQGHPALDALAALLRADTHALYPDEGADAIVASAVLGMAAMAVEHDAGVRAAEKHTDTDEVKVKVKDKEMGPGEMDEADTDAARWLDHARVQTGICGAYANLSFVRGWRASPESYIHTIP